MILARLAWRNAWRELRLADMRALLAALFLAVLALGTVATLTTRTGAALGASAAEMLGADAGVAAAEPPPAALADSARANGLATTRSAAFPTMAFAGDAAQMLDMLAVGPGWPLRGDVRLATATGEAEARSGPPAGTIWLDAQALATLHVGPGATVEIGDRSLRVGARIVSQPDGGQLLALAPRALMHLDDARALGLLDAGSRVRHRLLVAGTPRAVTRWTRAVGAALPAGAELVTPAQLEAQLRGAFNRAADFIQLAALLAAFLAAVAIALAARQHARRKVDEIALLRALGASNRRIASLITGGVAMLALPVALLAVPASWVLAEIAWLQSGDLLGTTAPVALPLAPALAAAGLGLALLAGFAAPPLLRLARTPPVAIFRRALPAAGWRSALPWLLPLAVAALLLRAAATSTQLAVILGASLGGVALLAAALSAGFLQLARTRLAGNHPLLRLGLASLARRRALAALQAAAIALGLGALLMLALVTPALLEAWQRKLPPDTPNWFALDVPEAARAPFLAALAAAGATQANAMPLATGKLRAINGVPVEDIAWAEPRTRRRAEAQLRLSWATAMAPDNRVIAGRWHGADPPQPEVSIDTSWRDRFNLALGDRLRFEVGAGTLEAQVTSIREVDWDSFRVNFFLVLDPAHAGALPHTWLASFHLPPGDAAALGTIARTWPGVSVVDVDELLGRVRGMLARVSQALQWVLLFSVLAGALVLAAALATTQRERRQEAALLRTLGAERRQLRVAAAAEFTLLGLVAGLTAASGSAIAGIWLARTVFELPDFTLPLSAIALAAGAATAGVLALGLWGTRRIIATPPLRLLRRP